MIYVWILSNSAFLDELRSLVSKCVKIPEAIKNMSAFFLLAALRTAFRKVIKFGTKIGQSVSFSTVPPVGQEILTFRAALD